MFENSFDMVLDLSSQAYKFPLNLALAECDACWNNGIMLKLVVRRLDVMFGNLMVTHMMCLMLKLVWCRQREEIPSLGRNLLVMEERSLTYV